MRTLIEFSRDGQFIRGWDLRSTSRSQFWTVWKKQESGTEYEGYDFSNRTTPLSEETLNERKAKLHPIFLDFLNNHDPAAPGSALAFLYYLKSRQAELKYYIGHAFSEIELFQTGGIAIGFGMEKGLRHKVTVDGMILFIREKNETFLTFSEMETAVDKIAQSNKTALLKNFLAYYKENQNTCVPRCALIENWVNSHQTKYKCNPFDLLTQHRETGCLRMFNPEKTASIQFFEKFLKGESISTEIRSMLDQDPYINISPPGL